MDTNKDNIPVSALYTSATWHWGSLPCADLVMPDGAKSLFRIVNVYMHFYRWVNPKKFSLQHTLLHRHTAINHLLKNARCSQVIEIAAGFSPRGSMVSADEDVCYFEIDMPDVVSLKRKRLANTDYGSAVLKRKNFTLKAGDITKLDFNEFPQERSFVITEGLMMYFTRDEQMKIWRNIADHINRCGGEYVFDYIPVDDEPPRSALGEMLSRWRLRRQRPTYSYDERTRSQIADDLRSTGFRNVDAYNSADVARQWQLPYGDTQTRVIVFRCR